MLHVSLTSLGFDTNQSQKPFWFTYMRDQGASITPTSKLKTGHQVDNITNTKRHKLTKQAQRKRVTLPNLGRS